MAYPRTAEADVHVHAHPADLPPEPAIRSDFGPKSARATGDACARVIPLHPDAHQEHSGNEKIQPYGAPSEGASGEFAAAAQAVADALEDAGFDRVAMTPVGACKVIVPKRGEADNWIIWTVMVLAGLARLLLVTVGHVTVLAGETRIRAGVALGTFLLALAFAFLVGHSAG